MATVNESISLAKDFDIQLQTVKFENDALELSGSGMLTRSNFNDIDLSATTDGGEKLLNHDILKGGRFDSSQLGRLTTPSQHWSVSGETADGWNFHCGEFDNGRLCKYRSDQPEVEWHFPLPAAVLSRESEISHSVGYLKAVFHPGSEPGNLFWHGPSPVDTRLGKITVSSKQDNLLLVEAYDLAEAVNIDELVEALGLTLSFHHGHKVLPVFFEAVIGKMEQRKWARRATHSKFSLPAPFSQRALMPLWDQRVAFLANAVPFFFPPMRAGRPALT